MEAPGFAPERVAPLRVVSTGAMGVSTAFVAAAADRLGARVKRSYGATEIPTITTADASDTVERGRETDGRALGLGRVRTVDPATGLDVGPGERGEVWFEGPEMFAGYLDRSANRDAMSGPWYRTGDLGVLDEGGWLRIVGRLKDLIIRAGENISPHEVERVLHEHPAVRQAVVVGYPDERVGERVAAFVVVDGTFGLEECRAWFAGAGRGPVQGARAGHRRRCHTRACLQASPTSPTSAPGRCHPMTGTAPHTGGDMPARVEGNDGQWT